MTLIITCVLVLLSVWMAQGVVVPKLKMNDLREMPAIALGTYLGFNEKGLIKSQNKELRDAVLHALEVGYRHFDTAAIYGTEGEIGEALKMKFEENELKREDVFVTTKLWNTHHGKVQVPVALRESLNQLGLKYVDLYLMHWPMGLNEDYSHSNVSFLETWRAMEELQRQGLAKSIGVSNFNKEQLETLIKECSVKPAALQIEVHFHNVQQELVDFAQSQGILVMAYSPFGSLVARFGAPGQGRNPVLVGIAETHGKTTAQVALRWLVDRGIVPIPKSVTPKRIDENINIFDFHLTPEEIHKISELNENRRYTLPSFWQNHPYYPFEKIENPIADPFRGNTSVDKGKHEKVSN